MITAHVTLWDNLLSTKGKTNPALKWDTIFSWFCVPHEFMGDKEHAGWSAAVFDPCERALANVVGVSAVVLDYDGTTALEEAERLWGEYYGFIHTTRKHTKDVHRFRVILPFGRTVAPSEYAAIWKRINARAGGKLDPAPKDPSRFWFTPGSMDPSTFEFRHLTGQLMDPDAVLDEPDPDAKVCGTHAPRFEPDDAAIYLRAVAYLDKIPGAISGSGGHGTLWKAALAMVQGFGLSEDAAHEMLTTRYNHRCRPPWSDKEIRHKVQSAARQARVQSNYVLDRDRDWAQRSGRQAPPTNAMVSAHTAPVVPEWDGPWHEAPVAAEQVPVPPEPSATRYGVLSVAELLNASFKRATAPKPERGSPSGCNILDAMISGFRRSMVTVLAASTSWGKSSFAIMAADMGMRAGKKVLLVSCEDSAATYGDRFMARRARVNALAIRDHNVSPGDCSKMTAAITNGERAPFFLSGVGKTVEYLAAAIRDICAEHDIDLVIFDYLQASSCAKKCQDRRTEITYIARTVTDAIKGANAAGLVFSQLKRLEDGHQPTMHDIKESGDVENMAEHVLIGWKVFEKNDPNVRRMLTIDKNKDGPFLNAPLELAFDNTTASFRADPVPLNDPGRGAAAVANHTHHDEQFGEDGYNE